MSSLVSSCLILPISRPCSPSLSSSVPSLFHSPSSPCWSLPSLSCFPLLSAVKVSYDAKPESSPVFNYINKTPCEVQWPRTQQPFLQTPSHPVVLKVAPCRPSSIGARLHFMADCKACGVSLSLLYWLTLNLQRFLTCLPQWRSY